MSARALALSVFCFFVLSPFAASADDVSVYWFGDPGCDHRASTFWFDLAPGERFELDMDLSQCDDEMLTIDYQNLTYPVSKTWGLICRAKVIEKWKINGAPTLSEDCTPICFEELASTYGVAEEFNALVKSLLDIDYYKNWVKL